MALLTRVRTRAELVAKRQVRALLDGRHASVSHGRSLDFSDLRAYVAGDDVADVDWKASARHGQLLVKRHVAERRATVLLVVDTGAEFSAVSHWDENLSAGAASDRGDLKRDVAVTAAGLIGWIASRAGDHVGLLHCAEHGPRAMRPSTREIDLERMLEAVVASCTPTSPPQRTLDLLDHAASAVRRRTLMVVVLGDVEMNHALERRLLRLAAQHELMVLTVADVDPTAPLRSGQRVRDVALTGRRVPGFAARDSRLMAELAQADTERVAHRSAVLKRLGVPHVHLASVEESIPELLMMLERRRRVR